VGEGEGESEDEDMSTHEFLTSYFAPTAATIGLGLAYAAWWRAGALGRRADRHLGRLATRLNAIDSLADSESVRVETRLLELEKGQRDAEALHSSLVNATGNDLFALKSECGGLWDAIKFLKREADGAGCAGKAAPEAARGWSIGELVETRGGNGVEFVAGDAGSN
jgi:hypothetical protein